MSRVEQCGICCCTKPAAFEIETCEKDNKCPSVLDRHLEVIFLLRKVLEVPVSQLEGFIKGCSDVESWIWICDMCQGLITECKLVFEQLMEVNRKWLQCKQKIVEVIKETVGEGEEDKEGMDLRMDFGVDIVNDTRRFAKSHEYGPWRNPFISGDFKARKLAGNLRNCVTRGIKEVEPEEWLEEDDLVCSEDHDLLQAELDNHTNTDEIEEPGQQQPRKKKAHPKPSKFSKILRKSRYCRPSRKPVNCHICGVSIHSRSYLPIHLSSIHSIGTLKNQCHKCQKTFSSKWKLQRHLPGCCGKIREFRQPYKVPEQRFRYKCPVEGCSLTWRIMTRYLLHLDKDHSPEEKSALTDNPNIYECSQCGQLTATRKEVNIHVSTSHGKKKHKIIQQKEEDAICDVCGKTFVSSSKLIIHKSRSLRCRRLQGLTDSELTVICDICGSQFTHKYTLQVHINQKHKGRMQRCCDHCGTVFEDKKKLDRHLAKVHEIGRHKCTVENCGKEFSVQRDLLNHQMGVHKIGVNPEGYKCKECGKVFPSPRNLDQHFRGVHQGRWGRKARTKTPRTN